MRSFATVAIVAAAVLSWSVSAAAQPPGGMRGSGPRYDTSTEVTISGTAQEVKDVPGRPAGTHIVLKTDSETVEVHLGPSSFLADQKLELKAGDAVRIIGSRVKIAGADAIIAREVRSGTRTVTLRDARGFPRWSRGARR